MKTEYVTNRWLRILDMVGMVIGIIISFSKKISISSSDIVIHHQFLKMTIHTSFHTKAFFTLYIESVAGWEYLFTIFYVIENILKVILYSFRCAKIKILELEKGIYITSAILDLGELGFTLAGIT